MSAPSALTPLGSPMLHRHRGRVTEARPAAIDPAAERPRTSWHSALMDESLRREGARYLELRDSGVPDLRAQRIAQREEAARRHGLIMEQLRKWVERERQWSGGYRYVYQDEDRDVHTTTGYDPFAPARPGAIRSDRIGREQVTAWKAEETARHAARGQ